MPLYELILIAKPGLAKFTGSVLKHCAELAQQHRIVLRNAKILGDRIMATGLRSKDFQIYLVGRYIQVLMDASPEEGKEYCKNIRKECDVLRVQFNKIKDYYEEIQSEVKQDEDLVKVERQILFEGERQRDLKKVMEIMGKKYRQLILILNSI